MFDHAGRPFKCVSQQVNMQHISESKQLPEIIKLMHLYFLSVGWNESDSVWTNLLVDYLHFTRVNVSFLSLTWQKKKMYLLHMEAGYVILNQAGGKFKPPV